ncbi:MAG: MurT ligase domain-containing protein [Methanobrevibacter sp.]|nr:MurT ligase domain-containing protein [Candidatus Methanoflexus mossambicus]
MLNKNGTALPGKIAMKISPNILGDLGKYCDKILIITGTNGKTTTTNLINHILNEKYSVLSNLKGSNMIQGVITPFIVDGKKHYDWGVFEVDEGSVPIVTQYLNADYIILTNFFRDQLDRYGEVDNTLNLVKDSINFNRPNKDKQSNKIKQTKLIINGDDPLNLNFKDLKNDKIYFGVLKNSYSKDKLTVTESIFCSNCGKRLEYEYFNYGNIGKFECPNCLQTNPQLDYYVNFINNINNEQYEFKVKVNKKIKTFNVSSYDINEDNVNNDEIEENNDIDSYFSNEILFTFKYLGIYNIYNCIAAIAFSFEIGLSYTYIKNKLETFDYKLGRMETIKLKDKEVILILSKNPVGLSEVLSTIIHDKRKKSVMFILNDEKADGQDISWIWDSDVEQIAKSISIKEFYASGMRSEEVALRLKYAGFDIDKIKTYSSSNGDNIRKSIMDLVKNGEKRIYVIGTFTAMPKARKILIELSNHK